MPMEHVNRNEILFLASFGACRILKPPPPCLCERRKIEASYIRRSSRLSSLWDIGIEDVFA